MVRQAFVLAGGKGERLRPLTEKIPKPLIEVRGKPILQYALENLIEHGVDEVILATGYLHEKIEEKFGDGSWLGISIKYSVEKEALGTGGALKAAREMLEERFAMLNGDNIADFDVTAMAQRHAKHGAMATLALVEVEDVSSYGIAKLHGERISEFVEKPRQEDAPSKLANAGCYIIERGGLSHLPKGFCMIEKTMFPQLAARGKLFGFMHTGKWFTTDTFERLKRAEENL
ncbi:MAG: nucleotidyltransferase family protein [archaeon]|nr:nucleotidyltransferase family protein [archaeon]